MSSPTFGSDQPGPDQTHPQGSPPPPPQGQPDWGAAPPPPAQQGYGAPAGYGSSAGLGAPAGYGAVTGQRPPQVLVAAMLGFVVAFFALLGSLALFALASLFGLLAVFGVLYLALAAVNIWGGIVAIQGKNSTILKIAGLVTAGLALLGLVLALTQGSFDFSSLLLIAAGVGIFVLLTQPVSQQWFASRGAR
ncbi:MAG TPA: hypothetical protein VE463_09065 [Blastococcus sp.]|nr:hypothetical protein [Blastococcus sp.]